MKVISRNTADMSYKQDSKSHKEPFWTGGAAASMAACFTHPLDQTKYRMQVLSSRTSLLRAVYQFAARDGVFPLWQGLSASILRQSTYSTARFALYGSLDRKINPRQTTGMTMVSAGVAGSVAGVIGNPAEIVLVRMSADGAKPLEQRYQYRNALIGLLQVGKAGGLQAYFRGLGPNIARSALMNTSQIATYTAAKSRLLATKELGLKDNTTTHILASLIAGTVATTVCAPADVLKSRFQNMRDNPQPFFEYLSKTAKVEGSTFLMKGWTPAWLRLAPNTVLTFVFMEYLKSVVNDR